MTETESSINITSRHGCHVSHVVRAGKAEVEIWPNGKIAIVNSAQLEITGVDGKKLANRITASGKPFVDDDEARKLIRGGALIGDPFPDGSAYLGKRESDGMHVITLGILQNVIVSFCDLLQLGQLMRREGVDDLYHQWDVPDKEDGRMIYAAQHIGALEELFNKSRFAASLRGRKILLATRPLRGSYVDGQDLDMVGQYSTPLDSKAALCLVRGLAL